MLCLLVVEYNNVFHYDLHLYRCIYSPLVWFVIMAELWQGVIKMWSQVSCSNIQNISGVEEG